MKVLIDACVLYPTVLRRLVTGLAATGYFTPLWSPRILEEWARAAARIGQEDVARGEIAALEASWPTAGVTAMPATAARLHLPDPDDIHVLASAIDGGADILLTLNLRDFPTRTLSAEGIVRRDPDGFLLEALSEEPNAMGEVIARELNLARHAGVEGTARAILKRAKLPKLGKRFEAVRGRSEAS